MIHPSITCLFFFVFISINNVACIKCFHCRSTNDPKCADPFDNSTVPITDCNRVKGTIQGIRATACQKISQQVNGEWHYIRECAYLEEADTLEDENVCVNKTAADNTIMEYCRCNSKDGCNSSAFFSPMPLFIMFSLMCFIYKVNQF